jgi:hypothetical protein
MRVATLSLPVRSKKGDPGYGPQVASNPTHYETQGDVFERRRPAGCR